jgi:tellurite resistance-related uncharacterized protein
MATVFEVGKRIDEMKGVNFSEMVSVVSEYSGADWRQYYRENIYPEDFYPDKNPDKNQDKVGYNKILLPFNFSTIDMYVIVWPKHFTSKFHDHAKNGCILKVLQGNLTEIVFTADSKIVKRRLCENDCNYMSNSMGVHKIENNSDDVAVTLHVYSPKKHVTRYFNDLTT